MQHTMQCKEKVQVGREKIVNEGLAFFLSKNHGSTQLVFLDQSKRQAISRGVQRGTMLSDEKELIRCNIQEF